MKRLPLLLILIIFTIPASAQTLFEAAEEMNIALRELHSKQFDATPFFSPLERIYELEEELRPREDRPSLGARCARIEKINELNEQLERLKAIKVRNKKARLRLKPLLEDLEGVIKAHGEGDDGSCKRLREAV